LKDTIITGLGAMGIECTGEQADALVRYAGLLTGRNRVMNLTAITEPDEIARLHFLDSAACLKLIPEEEASLVDVGTGAGFPGLVLKILRPSLRVTLLDSQMKRVGFLREVCSELGIDGVDCVQARAEEAGRTVLRESFDYAASRAVARMDMLSELCFPLVRLNGCFLAMKSETSDPEIKDAIPVLGKMGGRLEREYEYTIPGTDISRKIFAVRKIGGTPSVFPRRFSKMKQVYG
jgi:16S rRNA (guanine527-N7)-methyltransferase